MPERKSLIERMRDFFEDMQKDMLEAFGELSIEHCSWDPENCCLEPLTNMIETAEELIITADLPYVKKDNITLTVKEDMLELDASLDQPVKFTEWGTIQRDTEFHKFHKHIKLPSNASADKIAATFKNGFLQIKLPKKITRIKIEVK